MVDERGNMNKENIYTQGMFSGSYFPKDYKPDPSLPQPNWARESELLEANRQEKVKQWAINTARCYSNVFRDEPWNEAFCDAEGNFLGLDQVEDVTQWKQLGLERAYPLLKTRDYILKEISQPDSKVVYRTKETKPSQVYAFGWGYSFSDQQELVNRKWKNATAQEKRVMGNIINQYISSQKVWYLSEVGVLAKERQRGTATQLVTELVDKAPSQNPILMRTNANSPMTVIANKLGFEQILGPISERVGSEIIVSDSETINGYDPLNPQRVLYLCLPFERRSK